MCVSSEGEDGRGREDIEREWGGGLKKEEIAAWMGKERRG